MNNYKPMTTNEKLYYHDMKNCMNKKCMCRFSLYGIGVLKPSQIERTTIIFNDFQRFPSTINNTDRAEM